MTIDRRNLLKRSLTLAVGAAVAPHFARPPGLPLVHASTRKSDFYVILSPGAEGYIRGFGLKAQTASPSSSVLRRSCWEFHEAAP